MAEFFVDENLDGAAFLDRLEAAGATYLTARGLGVRGVADAAWIPRVAKIGLIVVTADVRIRYSPLEKQAIVNSGARMVFLRRGQHATHALLAKNFVNAIPAIRGHAVRHVPPWLVTLGLPADPRDVDEGVHGRINPIHL